MISLKKLFGSALGLVYIALSLISISAFFYFQYFTAKHDHWIAFIAGLVFPPLSVVGGALIWFGLIWQSQPSSDDALFEARQLMQSSTTFGMVSNAASRCKWDDFSQNDIAIANKMQNSLLQKLKSSFAFSDNDLQKGRDAARKFGDAVDCGNQAQRESMRRWMNGMEAMGRRP